MTGANDTPAAYESVPDSYAAYASECDEPRVTDWLRAQSGQSWLDATAHRFTRQLHADTLDDAVFRTYLVQDYAFLETLVSAFGYAVGQAPTMAAKARLSEFLGTLTAEENEYFERSFEALGVSDVITSQPTLASVTAAFRDLLLRASRQGEYAETLAVLVPAEWIYLTWATNELGDERPERFYLDEWIELHAGSEFESFVDWLRRELDREGAAASERRQTRLAELFSRTVELEVAFFDTAYSSDGDATAASGGEQSW